MRKRKTRAPPSQKVSDGLKKLQHPLKKPYRPQGRFELVNKSLPASRPLFPRMTDSARALSFRFSEIRLQDTAATFPRRKTLVSGESVIWLSLVDSMHFLSHISGLQNTGVKNSGAEEVVARADLQCVACAANCHQIQSRWNEFGFRIFVHRLCPHLRRAVESVDSHAIFLSDPRCEDSQFCGNHPLGLFLRFLIDRCDDMSNPLFPPEMREHFRARIDSRPSIVRRGLEDMNGLSLASLMRHMKAYFLLLQCHATSGHAVYEGQVVGALCAVVPWARSVLARCSHLQLDATFQAVHPYVLSVPLAIVANESFPLRFVMAPNEEPELYRIFADCTARLRMPEYASKPILRDGGSGLQADAAEIGAPHF
jgi:hypothetical protein